MKDEDDKNGLIQRCQKLKHKFHGVFAADNFPSKLKSNTFLIVNASKSQSPGTHWLLICKKNAHLLFADPLERSLSSYKNIYQRLAKNNVQFHLWLENQPIQCQNSELCGLFCTFIAHLIFDNRQIVVIFNWFAFLLTCFFNKTNIEIFFSKLYFFFLCKTNK